MLDWNRDAIEFYDRHRRAARQRRLDHVPLVAAMTPEPESADPAAPASPTRRPTTRRARIRRLMARGKDRVSAGQARVNDLLERYGDRPLLDVGLRIYQRDRESAGTVVGSALAFRLFLFFVPLLLFVVGLLGFVADFVEDADAGDAGITGSLARRSTRR